MAKRILTLLLIVTFAACKKNDHQKSPCSIGICTAVFASINIQYIDKNGAGVVVTNYSVRNMRTGLAIKAGANNDVGAGFPGLKVVANDGNLKEFSSDGDEVQVSATDPATHQAKTVTFKISGGCTCHVGKISGPEVVTFD
jgi:hypothetical protein